MATQRDLALAYSPGVADACMEIARDPAEADEPDLARQSGGRHHQRHRGAGPGQHRPAGRQAGDGRQGLPVQEVRRHRRVRHRAGRERPRRADRHHRAHGADLRRHQPRGHQGAGVLLHRDQAARAHEDPGLPRRPARHRHRRRGGDPERAEACRQGHRRSQARRLRCGRGGAGLPGPDRQPRPADAQHLRLRQRGRGLRRPQGADGPEQGPLCAADAGAQAGRDHRRGGRVPRPVGRRRAQARDGHADGARADHPGDGQPDAGNPAGRGAGGASRRDHRHRPFGLSEPGQQRAVLPVHLPRRARRRRDDASTRK